MTDLVYLVLTVVSFAGLALLVGAIDHRLPPPDPRVEADDPEPAREADEVLAGTPR
ncbi:MAG: hypothetical protein J2O46_07405 [Nocardioides sp.]|nr:hypothetical protein [Nocardioides sp.]